MPDTVSGWWNGLVMTRSSGWPLPPSVSADARLPEMVNPGSWTSRVTVSELVPGVPVPLIVSLYLPGAVLSEVTTWRVELEPFAGTVVGENVPDAPAGSPDTASATDPVKPPLRCTETVKLALVD